MAISKRREEIAAILLAEGKIKVGELAKRFKVSTETIRKDLIFLEEKGIIKKNRGSAEVRNEYEENNYVQKSQDNMEQKQEIAVKAAKLIPNGSTLILDAGSTTYQLARQLILRKDVTVITNFIPIADLLHSNGLHVIATGGEIRLSSGAMTGIFAKHCLENVNADIAFLSTSGFKGAFGPCVENFPEADIKRIMMQNATQKYLLADSSKAEVRAMVKFGDWDEFEALITDKNMDSITRNDLEQYVNLE